MKINQSGDYEVLEGNFLIRDIETGEEMIFVIDPKEKIVIRSMLEDDIEEAMNLLKQYSKQTSSERRKNKRLLLRELPKKNSVKYYFVAEKIVTDNCKTAYEEEREIIGLGTRECVLEKPEVSIVLFKEEGMIFQVSKLLEKIANHFGIVVQK